MFTLNYIISLIETKNGSYYMKICLMTDAILYLYHNEEERARMGEYGHNRVIKKYNWNFLVSDYLTVFQDVIRE